MSNINSIQLEVISNALLSISEQMGVILTKTAYSTNIKERKDSSVGIFNAQGKLLALAQHIPIHFSSLFGAVHEVLKKWRLDQIYEGDVFISNDPYTGGGSHLPDIVLVNPVFYNKELVAFVVNIGHHADKSRRGPTIYDEGLRIPIVRLYKKGQIVQDVYDMIMLNFQLKTERQGDLRAQLITNRFGADKVIELCDKIGMETYLCFCTEWLKYGQRKARAAIAELQDGAYEFHDTLDDDGCGNKDLLIHLKLTVTGDRICFDFSQTCPQITGPFNCVKNATLATVYYAVKCLLDNTIPANSGYFDSIDVSLKQGTLVCAKEPAPTFDRETTTQRIADVIFGAFSKINKENVIAAGNGAVSFFSFSGTDTRTGSPYVYVETIGGGSGARYNKDGLDAVQVHMTNSSNLPIEALEMEYPLLVEKYALAENSGGPGLYRGGMGIVRSIQILKQSKDTELIASTERIKSKPWGLFGGKEGANAYLDIRRDQEKLNRQNKVRNMKLQDGDVVKIVTAGAGGYGPPEKRRTQSIEKDLREQKITPSAALEQYPGQIKNTSDLPETRQEEL